MEQTQKFTRRCTDTALSQLPIRQTQLTSTAFGSAVCQTAPFPRDLIGPDDLHRVLTNGDDRELDALLCNPSLSDKLLEELYRHTNAFASIPEERWSMLVYVSRKNERLRTKDNEDDMPDMGYYSIHRAIFQLLEIVPLEWR
jgi:hypothetical protein